MERLSLNLRWVTEILKLQTKEFSMHFRYSLMLLSVTLAAAAAAQQPARAPRDTTTVNVNGKPVSIAYGRPSLGGRTVDDLLKRLPPDRMWRIGANNVTTLTTETVLVIGGKEVAPGRYTLYVHVPETGEWQLAVNKDPGIPVGKLNPKVPPERAQELWPRLDGYDKNIKDMEVAREVMKQGSLSASVDPFTMILTSAKGGALLTMSWGDRTWSAEFGSK
jgi:hypothetical protein